MEFVNGRSDVVRAINQRWLLKFWKRHLGDHRVPQWQVVTAESLSSLSSNLSFLDVSSFNGSSRFLFRFNGATIGQAYGATDCRGKYLDEIMAPSCLSAGLFAYETVVNDGCPIYTIQDIADCEGRLVHFERLLLPFAANGQTVDRVLASFEFVCLDGAFDIRDIMHVQPAPPKLRLAAKIEPHALA